MTKKIAIIVAGGKGLRLDAGMPKQFLLLAGEPVLYWSMKSFYENDPATEIVNVIHKDFIGYWKDLLREHNITIPHKIVEGGEERFFSVKNALESLPDEDAWAAVHDAARPFISPGFIKSLFQHAAEYGSALPALPLKDSIRQKQGEAWKPVIREEFQKIQTPQIFRLLALKEAYRKADYSGAFTDDAGVMEEAGFNISLATGDEKAFKITTAFDLDMARKLADNWL